MSTRTRVGAWFFLLSAWACGGGPEPAADEDCIPNQSVGCTCPSGGVGVKECTADGSGYGECTQCKEPVEGCSHEPDCNGCTSCFDSCVCQGGDAKTCLKSCAGAAGGGGGGGGPSGGGGGSSGGGTGGTPSGGGSSGGGGYSGGGGGGGGALDCSGCVSQSCGNELSGCSQTSGCMELVQCADQSGCSMSDYGCLLMGCGAYMINFKAVPAAVSLGNCAASACAAECS
ncbi:MAG: hypothetical protein L6Q84_30320 [Polyangiaceae bacterium]|nr:hypothetical protein [Polyangiaceae bacterium]